MQTERIPTNLWRKRRKKTGMVKRMIGIYFAITFGSTFLAVQQSKNSKCSNEKVPLVNMAAVGGCFIMKCD